MDIKVIEKLMVAMETHHIHKLAVKEKEFEISLERGAAAVIPVVAPAVCALPTPTLVPHVTTEEKPGTFVTAPIVGTFYAASSPNDSPLVKVGNAVTPESVVCIIEAMKVMNEVKAGVAGTVAEVCVKSGDPVEFGTKMLRIIPSEKSD